MLTQTARFPSPLPLDAVLPPALPDELFNALESMGSRASYRRGAEIYGEGEPAEFVYKVLSGSVRTYKILDDGRRQIGAFYLAGDFFGLEGGKEHHFSAEAVGCSSVQIIKRSVLMARASRDIGLANQLWAFTARELARVRNHTLLLVQTAQERVAAFLLEMAERLRTWEAIELPMSRQDIADYLGLTIETVSRTLTQLEAQATIALPSSRRIVLRDCRALRRLNA